MLVARSSCRLSPRPGATPHSLRALIAIASLLVFASASPAGRAATASVPATSLTQAALTAILAQGVDTTKVPSNLAPSLAKARHDVSLAWRDGCVVGHGGTEMPGACVFGDRRSRKTVVLFGDSHAAAWFGGLNVVSHQQHWRLVFMGKMGCPTVSDVLVKRDDGVWYHSCVAWRHNMERRTIKLHPRLLIITSSNYLGRAEPDFGRHNPDHDRTWVHGVEAVFKNLRHAARRVAFIANTPALSQPAYRCVAAHRSDVFPCTVTPSQAFLGPAIREREFQLARSNGIAAVDPAPWFCTTTRCPVIADDTLIFRDSQHMTPEWSKFLAPMLAQALVPLVTSSPKAAASRPTGSG